MMGLVAAQLPSASTAPAAAAAARPHHVLLRAHLLRAFGFCRPYVPSTHSQTPPSDTHLSHPKTDDEFAGFVLKGGGRGSASAAAQLPGPLPRYGEAGGAPYMLLEAPARDVVAICK